MKHDATDPQIKMAITATDWPFPRPWHIAHEETSVLILNADHRPCVRVSPYDGFQQVDAEYFAIAAIRGEEWYADAARNHLRVKELVEAQNRMKKLQCALDDANNRISELESLLPEQS